MALEQEEPPLGPLLVAISAASSASQAVADLLAWDVDRLTSAWYRHCGALMAGESRINGLVIREVVKLADFADELLSVRRQLLSTNSANQRLLYERLAVRWQGAVSPG